MQRLLPRPVSAGLLTFAVAQEDFPAQMSTECLVIKPANLRFRPNMLVRFSSIADMRRGPFGISPLSLGCVSRVAPSAHVLRTGLRPVLPLYFAAGATRLPQPGTMSARNRGTQPCVLQRRAWLGCGAHERLSPDVEQY